jgi:hypothetical protein
MRFIIFKKTFQLKSCKVSSPYRSSVLSKEQSMKGGGGRAIPDSLKDIYKI